MNKIMTAFTSAAFLLCAATAQAGVYQLDFTASNFSYAFSDVTAPQESVKGSIRFTADAPWSRVTSISAIDLTIGDHVYTVDEVGAEFWTNARFFGGEISGVSGVSSNTDDFWIATSGNSFSSFAYATGRSTYFYSTTGTATVTELAEIPEPGSLALMLAGICGFGTAMQRRRRKSAGQAGYAGSSTG